MPDRLAAVVFLGWKSRAKRVKGGETHRRKCPECEKTAVFHECILKREYSAYIVLKLWESKSEAYECGECGEVMDLDDTEDPELTPKEKAAALAEAKRAEKEKVAALDARLDRQKADEARKEAEVDDELAAMKKRLGLD